MVYLFFMTTRKTAFITGITGFVGRYLSDLLIAQGWTVAGLDQAPSCDIVGAAYHQTDLLDTQAVSSVLAEHRPDRIFHLAAVSFPPDADRSPRYALEINIMGTVSLLDAVRSTCPAAALLLVGSSKEYGDRPGTDPITESCQIHPSNLYGISKYAAEMIGQTYARQFQLDIRCARSFNHTGPGQSQSFVCSDWTKQVAEVEHGKALPRIRVGDLSSSIDFTDVRDVVRAYALILEKGAPGEIYNVCSGTSVQLETLLARVIALAKQPIEIVRDTVKLKALAKPAVTIGDHTKLTRDTGWNPEIPLEKTLSDLYSFWIRRIKQDT
jgi:GDP-4-dehydro-6-deoxy-D-mannose reductase